VFPLNFYTFSTNSFHPCRNLSMHLLLQGFIFDLEISFSRGWEGRVCVKLVK